VSKDPTPRVKQIVWVLAGGLCVRCKSNVLDAAVALMPLGEVAHVAGKSDDASAPRPVPDMPGGERNAAENLLLLCRPCHRIVDDELGQSVYGIETLLDMKRDHERNVRHLLSLIKASSTLVVRVVGALHGQITSVARLDAAAVAAERRRVPVYLPRLHHADLEVDLTGVEETEPAYWDWCMRRIEDSAEQLKDALDSGLTDHVTLFGFARMPLLVLLGWYLDDNFEVDVVHLSHEEPRWLAVPDASSYEFEVIVEPGKDSAAPAEALLVLRLSGDPDASAFPDDTRDLLRVVVQPADGQTRRDIADAEASQLRIARTLAMALDRIESELETPQRLHVLGAAPNDSLIQLGRAIDPSTFPTVCVYDRQGGSYQHVYDLTHDQR
jgi:hypothetical protein